MTVVLGLVELAGYAHMDGFTIHHSTVLLEYKTRFFLKFVT
jgi:hypothetical protein